MNLDLTDEQDVIRSTARELLRSRLPSERLHALVDDGRYDDELWTELTRLGWAGLAIAEEHGGQGLGLFELSLLCEQLGRALAPVPFVSNAAAGLLLAGAGSPDQQREHLPALAAGTGRGAIATIDADGMARLAVDAVGADVLVLVEGDRAWLAGPQTTVAPSRSIDSSRRYATVDPDRGDALPGPVGPALDRLEVLLAAELVGLAERALELAVAFACERKQFGRPIGSFQGVSHRCARMLLETENARAVMQYAAWVADHEEASLPLAASVAKAAASRAGTNVCGESLQVHGGIGFTWEADVHLLLKRARATAQLLGTASEHRRRIAALRRDGAARAAAVA